MSLNIFCLNGVILVLLFYELVKHKGDIGIYDAIRDLKDDFDRVKCVENA